MKMFNCKTILLMIGLLSNSLLTSQAVVGPQASRQGKVNITIYFPGRAPIVLKDVQIAQQMNVQSQKQHIIKAAYEADMQREKKLAGINPTLIINNGYNKVVILNPNGSVSIDAYRKDSLDVYLFGTTRPGVATAARRKAAGGVSLNPELGVVVNLYSPTSTQMPGLNIVR